MATFLNGTEKHAAQDIETCPKWFVFDVETATTSEDITLMQVPEGLIIDDVYAITLVAEAGAANSGIDLEGTNQGGASRTIWAGGADGLGATGRVAGTLTVVSLGPSTDAQGPENLVAEYTSTGTATTAPQFRLCILMHRILRPGADPASA